MYQLNALCERAAKLGRNLSMCAAFMVVLSGCGGSSPSRGSAHQGGNSPSPAAPALSEVAVLGKQIFFDQTLSVSGVQSCGTCHVPARAHAGDDDLSTPLGGVDFKTSGFRNAPSINYLQFNPVFFFDKEGTPTGGLTRDGRADNFLIQAEGPFLAAHEMANTSSQDVVQRLESAAYASEFRRLFGADIFDDSAAAFKRAAFAIAKYEMEDPIFHPFDSKFDGFLQGKNGLNEQELWGYALFNNPQKGNCAACHPSSPTNNLPPLFTDFTYDNLGVPRNFDIPATADKNYFDLGLCGPTRLDFVERKDLCGAFKVPSLRNVAITAPYFHNGKFKTLKDVVRFYVRRDTHPDEWYPVTEDGVQKFNDLPLEYHKNVNVTEAPYNRKLGDQPALNDEEIEAVVAFLNTLTDGYLKN